MGQENANPRLGANLSAGTTIALAGTITFSSSNMISFGMDSVSRITASVVGANGGIAAISAGSTQITSGQAVFSNSNGLSFGMNGQVITADLPRISFWNNSHSKNNANQPSFQNFPLDVFLQHVSLPLALRVTRAEIIVFCEGRALGQTATLTAAVGAYTMSGSTASLASQMTVTSTFLGQGINSQTLSWVSLTGTLNLTPGNYLIAIGGSVSNGAADDPSFIGEGAGGGIAELALPYGNDDNGTCYGDGAWRSSFNGSSLPGSIHVTDIVKTYSSASTAAPITIAGGQPYIQFAGS